MYRPVIYQGNSLSLSLSLSFYSPSLALRDVCYETRRETREPNCSRFQHLPSHFSTSRDGSFVRSLVDSSESRCRDGGSLVSRLVSSFLSPRPLASRLDGQQRSGRWRGEQHPTGLDERLGDNPRSASPKRLSLIGLVSRPRSLAFSIARPFEWNPGCFSPASTYFYQPFPNQLFPASSPPGFHTSGETRFQASEYISDRIVKGEATIR